MSQDPIRPATPKADAMIGRLLKTAEPPPPVKFSEGPVANRKRRRALRAIKRRKAGK
jgi:hypothetical protein